MSIVKRYTIEISSQRMFFEGQAGAKKKNILTVFYLATLDLLELLHGCRKVRMLLRTAGIYDYPVFSNWNERHR